MVAAAVRGDECDVALTLGVSLKLAPQGTLVAASAGMLSADGRCKTLDARANGYTRSEAVGASSTSPRISRSLTTGPLGPMPEKIKPEYHVVRAQFKRPHPTHGTPSEASEDMPWYRRW